MRDLFHEAMPLDFLQQIFDVMVACPHHTFQIPTKWAERPAELAPLLPWPEHIWVGTT